MPTSPRRQFGNVSAQAVLLGAILIASPWLLAAAATGEKSPAEASLQRLDPLTAEQLHQQLLKVPEVELLGGKEAKAELEKECRASASAKPLASGAPPVLNFQRKRWEALGLVCRPESDQLLFRHEAEHLSNTALLLRSKGVVSLPDGRSSLNPPSVKTGERFESLLRVKAGDPLPHHVTPALNQLLQAEDDAASRALLVESLARIDTNYSTCCLAERALYDLAPQVRQAAIKALRQRPREEFRPMLLDAFRYPWAPAAQHAAEALVALQDRDALPALTKLLDAPDPGAAFVPTGADQKPLVREVVRVNHLTNCLLCHAPSTSVKDVVTGPVPKPGEPLSTLYYGHFQPSRPANGDLFVRADVTYLRQDFSVMQKVAKAEPWPDRQRFDFLVRTRAATAEEAARKPAADFPQRQALLFAIEKLKSAIAADKPR